MRRLPFAQGPRSTAAIPTALLCAGLAALAGCELQGPSPGWRIVVDSAAAAPVRVVNEPLADSIPATARVAPSFRLGGVDVEGPTSFGLIAQMAADETGRLAVLDRQAAELRIFDLDGNHLRTFGGEGGGPGELRWAFGVIRRGEELLVPEQGNARISVFHPDRGYVGWYPYHFRSYAYQGWEAVVDTAGRLVVPSSGPASSAVGGGQLMIRRYDRELEPIDTIPYRTYADLGEGATYRLENARGGFSLVPVPFHSREHVRLDRTGSFWRVAGQGYRLIRHVPGGDTLRIVDVARPPRPVTADERDSALAAIRERLRERGISPDLDASRIPDTHPQVYDLTLAANGDVWVRVTAPDAGPTTYDVLDRTGRLRETVRVPGRVDPAIDPVIRGDRFWAVVIDELDVQYVVGGRIEAVGQAGPEAP